MKQKIGKILIALFVILLCASGCAKKEKQEVKEQEVNYEALYNTYVKSNVISTQGLSSISEESFELQLDENSPKLAIDNIKEANTGVIGRYIADLDGDDIPEMILSYVDDSDENKGALMIDVYTIKDGKIKKVDGELQFEFFYNKCRGNLHIFLQEVNGERKLCVLKAFERSFGVLFYEMSIDVYCMEEGKMVRYAHEEMVEGDYGEQAMQIAKNVKEEINLGEWFEKEFIAGLGENGTTVFAPYNYTLSTRDKSITDVARIQALLDRGIQTFKYYDYANMREEILYEDVYKKLIADKLIPEMGIAGKAFNAWENINIDAGECYGEVAEEHLGLVSAIEFDFNQDEVLELLVFYLKQEVVESAGGGNMTKQNLYIDLYTQKNHKAKFVCTVDVLEPVLPWSSVFAYEDTLDASIRQYEGNTYLYIERGCTNEGPVQVSYSVYNLTNMESIEKIIYYMPIIDGDRLNGELLIPAGTLSGSSGEHEFIAKVENEKVELYFESFWGEPETRYGDLKFKTYEEAEQQVASELKEMGYVKEEPEERMQILWWQYLNEGGPYVHIDDNTFLSHYSEAIQQKNMELQEKADEIEQKTDEVEEDVSTEVVPESTPQDVVPNQPQDTPSQQQDTQSQQGLGQEVETENLIGEWEIDVEKFNAVNSDSLSFAYGSGIKYGHSMTLSSDSSFSYYIGISVDGYGTYTQQGNQIVVNITSSDNGCELGGMVCSVVKENGTTYILMNDGDYQIYWRRK